LEQAKAEKTKRMHPYKKKADEES